MDLNELAVHLEQVDGRSQRNEGRIKKLEGEHEVLQNLTTSVAVMAEQLKNMNANFTSLNHKVDELEAKPVKRWETVVSVVITAVVSAVIGFALARLGI